MQFIHQMFLYAGATAAVPIIIHLVQRRRVQKIMYSSLRFLQKTSHRVVHRRRFEELLLVLLRALALAALALAFARPFFWKPAERVGGKTFLGEEAALILVDHSYSMGAEGRLKRAKARALEVLKRISPVTKFGVAEYSSRVHILCPIGAKLPEAQNAIREIKLSSRGTKLSTALRDANRTLTKPDRNEQYRRIILIGDFQRSAWKDRSDWKLTPGVELQIENVAQKTVPNVLIDRVAVPRLVVAGGFVEVISANIRNLTDKPLKDAQALFKIGDKVVEKRRVNIPAGAASPVRFRHAFKKPGDIVGSISVDAKDELPLDNIAHFSVHVTPQVNVLLVNGDQNTEMVKNDGLFLKTALVPAIKGQPSPFQIREIAPHTMTSDHLKKADAVIFANVSDVPPAMVEIPKKKRSAKDKQFHSPLGRFVAKGGGIAFLCGPKVEPETFNRVFGALAPCKLWRPALEETDLPVAINRIEVGHEIFAPFAEPHTGDFALAEFRQYFLVKDSQTADVLARFNNKDQHPALLERDFAKKQKPEKDKKEKDKKEKTKKEKTEKSAASRPKGKSILLVSPLDLEWNNLCLKSVFVPFVHQLARRLCATQTTTVRNLTVGDEITYRLPDDVESVKLTHTTVKPLEADKPATLKAQPVGDGIKAVSLLVEKPGVYELVYKGGEARFAVNLDPNEPDLRPLDTKLLKTVEQDEELEIERTAGSVSVVAKSTARERMEASQKTWTYVIGLVLLVLLLEMILAIRIGTA